MINIPNNTIQKSIIIEELIDEEAFMANLPSVDDIKMTAEVTSEETDLLDFDY